MKICLACAHRFAAEEWHCPACGHAPTMLEGFPAFAPELARSGGHFVPENYGAIAAREDAHFWFRARRRLILWALRRYFSGMTSFLEIGCGTGMVLEGIRQEWPNCALTACDIYPDGLHFAQQRVPGAVFCQLDACRLPFEGEFDVAGMFDALEHIDADADALRQVYQALTPGGGIVLTVPQHPFLWSAIDDYSRHRRRYTRRELAAKLREAGFEIVRMTSTMALLLPLLMLMRRCQPKEPGDVQPFSEYGLARPLDAALDWTLRLEHALIRAGLNAPAGGTLLAVARRPSTP